MSKMYKIGLSACFFHPDRTRKTFAPKTLLYNEQSMAHWLMTPISYPVLIPTPTSEMGYNKLIEPLDALVIHGGADMDPASYGEEPISMEWLGDGIRDEYEINLYKEAKKQRKPILGICRGMQVMNVAEGGTLYQDISTQVETDVIHRNPIRYDNLFHEINIIPNTELTRVYGDIVTGTVNSVHHQAIKELAPCFEVEARCPEDDIIEAIRWSESSGIDEESDYIYGVQWHPEFMTNAGDNLDPVKLRNWFLKQIEIRNNK